MLGSLGTIALAATIVESLPINKVGNKVPVTRE